MQASAGFFNALSCAVSPQVLIYLTCIREILLLLSEQFRTNLNVFREGEGGELCCCFCSKKSIRLYSVFLENSDIEDLLGM